MAKWDSKWKDDLDDSLEYQIRVLAQDKGSVAAIATVIMFLCKVISDLSEQIRWETEEQA